LTGSDINLPFFLCQAQSKHRKSSGKSLALTFIMSLVISARPSKE